MKRIDFAFEVQVDNNSREARVLVRVAQYFGFDF